MTPPNDADLRFKASLDDELTPNLERLEKKLKEMGATPREIKMMIKAVDDATPKIKETRKLMDRFPKLHKINFDADTSKVNDSLQKIKDKTRDPIRLNFVDNLEEKMNALTSIRTRIPLGGAMPGGSNMLAATGGLAAAVGGVTALTGVVQQGIQVNSQMEQSMVTLQQTLKDHTKATQEMGKIVNIAQKTPFQYQDVLQADVRLRSYAIPSMQGEGGPKNQGWLKSAGDMAAAMNTPITQAVEAIADARQGYFVRMMSYGIRMMREDFQAGGKYAGMTFEQGLGQAIKRFEGAQEAQSKTFQGLMSNVKDIVQQQILRPIGAVPFEAAKTVAQSLQDKMQTPEFQMELGRQIQKVQEAFVSMFSTVQRGKQYFEQNLKQPLMDFGKQVISIGGTLVKTFGGVLVEVLTTAAKLFGQLAKPVTAFIESHQNVVKVYAAFKALSLLGFKGPADSLSKLGDAINPLHPSVFKLIAGFRELGSSAVKIAIAGIVAGFVNAKSAANNLENAMKKAGRSSTDEFRSLNAEIAKASGGLDTTANKLSGLTSDALNNLEGGGPQTALLQAKSAAALQRDYGIDSGKANQIMDKMNINSQDDVKKAAVQIRALDSAAKQLKLSFDDVTKVMTMYAGQVKNTALAGPGGAPYLAAINQAVNKKGFLTADDTTRGIYSGDDYQRQLIDAWQNPSADAREAIRKSGHKLGDYYHYNQDAFRALSGGINQDAMNREGLLGGAGIPQTETSTDLSIVSDTRNRYKSNIRAADQNTAQFNRQLQQANVPMDGPLSQKDFKLPSLVNRSLPGTVPDVEKLVSSSKNAADAVEKMNKAIADTEGYLSDAQNSIDIYNQKINDLNKTINSVSIQQQVLSMATEKLQHSYLPLQRQIEDLQLTMQKTTFNVMRPMERQSAALSQQMAELGNQSSNAQYNMEKFSGGLLTGEQAALNSMHAMEKYNRQLQIMQLQYQQIGAQLGTTTYDRGVTSRVNPLMGLSLQMQMERLQKKSELANLKYQDTYGEQHYQMEQAARPKTARTEMSFAERMKGIKENVPIIDHVREAQHHLSNVQFDLQTKMYHANVEIQKQQDHLQRLQMKLTDKQLHGGLRELQDLQYHLGRKAAYANIELTKQQTLLAGAQENLNDYKTTEDRFTKERNKILNFGGSPKDAASRLVAFGEASGFIAPGKGRAIENAIALADKGVKQAGKDYINTKGNIADEVKHGIWGAFTGDLWRRLSDIYKGGAAKIIGAPGASIFAPIMTFLTAGYALSVIAGAIGLVMRQTVIRGALGALMMGLPEGGKARGIVSGVREVLIGDPLKTQIGNVFRPIRRLKGKTAGRVVRAATGPLAPIAGPLAEQYFTQNSVSDIVHGNARGPNLGAYGPLGESAQNKFDKAAEKVQSAASHIGIGGKDIKDGSARQVRAARVTANAAEKEKDNVFANKDASKDQRRAAASQHRAAQKNLKNVDQMRDDLLRHRVGSERMLTRVSGRFGSVVRRFGGRVGIFAAAVEAFQLFGDKLTKWMEVHLPGVKKTEDPKVAAHKKRGWERDAQDAAEAHAPDAAHEHMPHQTRPTIREAVRGVKEAAKENPGLRKALEEARKRGQKTLVWGGRVLRIGAGALNFAPAIGELAQGHVSKAALSAANAGTYLIPGVGEARMAYDMDKMIKDTFFKPLNHPAAHIPGYAHAGGVQSLNERQITGSTQFAQWLSNSGGQGNKSQDQLLREYTKWLADNIDHQKKAHKISADEYSTYHDQLTTLEKKYRTDTDTDTQKYQDNTITTLRNHLDNRKTITKTGLDGIYDITDKHLTKLHHRLNTGAKAMGVDPAGGGGAPDTSPSHDTRPSGTHAAANHPHASGGFPNHHILKGKGDGKGYLIRVGEEEDELIIPMAAHRRDRARSLVKHAAGLVGGFANGGSIREAHAGHDMAYNTAKAAYTLASRSIPAFARGGPATPRPNLPDHHKKLLQMVHAAKDLVGMPYQYGGHHPGGPQSSFDCSSSVSHILAAGGFPVHGGKDTSVLRHWGRPGPGKKVTVAVTPTDGDKGHTMMRLGHRYFEANGPAGTHMGWRPGWSLPFSVFRHPPGFASGGIPKDSPLLNNMRSMEELSSHALGKRKFLASLPEHLQQRLLASSPTDILPGFASGGHTNSRLQNLIQAANAIDHKHFPYVWGGGHSGSTMGGPYDCSGSVSAILRAAGYLKPNESHVSGDFASMFAPGKGLATIYANPEHVYMTIDGRGWGTSTANPDGGAGWFTGGARPGFTARHLPDLEGNLNSAQLSSLLSTLGGTGDTGGAAGASIDLPQTPRVLLKRGPVGMMAYRALQKMKRSLQGTVSGGGVDPTQFHGGGDATKNMALGKRMAASMGWTGSQWNALKNLWMGESGWDQTAENPGPGHAYGIPQALPGDKMASAGSDWRTNPATQIAWGLGYIKNRPDYGSPAKAWALWQSRSPHWYHNPSATTTLGEDQHARLQAGQQVLGRHLSGIISGYQSHGTSGARAAMASNHTDPAEAHKRNQTRDTIEQIRDAIKEAVKQLKDANTKKEKDSDTKHLADLNSRLREAYAKRPSAAAVAGSLKTTIFNEGDTTGGMGTQALVAKEQGTWNKEKKIAVDAVIHTPEYKEAVKTMHSESKRAARVVSEAHSKHSPGGAKVTHLEQRAITLTKRASRSAAAIPAAIKRHAALTAYLPGAVQRGVDPRLIKSITGQALSGAHRALRDTHGKILKDAHGHARMGASVAGAYKKAVEAKPGKAQEHAIKDLKSALSRDLKAVKATASKDHRAASRAITAAFGKHTAHAINEGKKGASKISKNVKDGHPLAQAAVAATKNVKGSSDKADAKRTKAEDKSDRRERDYQTKSLKHLEAISKQVLNVDVTVQNTSQGGKIDSRVTTTKRKRSR